MSFTVFVGPRSVLHQHSKLRIIGFGFPRVVAMPMGALESAVLRVFKVLPVSASVITVLLLTGFF